MYDNRYHTELQNEVKGQVKRDDESGELLIMMSITWTIPQEIGAT